jgi:streptogramin lyase
VRGAGFVRRGLKFGALGAAIGLLAPLLVAVPAGADPAGTMVEFDVPTPSAFPSVTTPGPPDADNIRNVWFSETSGNKIGEITADGTITEVDVPTAGSLPIGVTTGPDSNIWFTENGGNKIAKLIPATGVITEFSSGITAGAGLTLITPGPDGNLWFCEQAQAKVARITLEGVVTEFDVGGGPSGIIAGADGNMWFTEWSTNKIARIATDGSGFTEFAIPTASARPIEIKVGVDGNLWFGENEGNKIGRVTVDGTITEFDVPTPASLPAGISNGLDGNIWFTETDGDNIGRLLPVDTLMPNGVALSGQTTLPDATTYPAGTVLPDGTVLPVGTITEWDVPTAASSPGGISPGPDGRLWFAEQEGNKIGRVSTGAPWTVNIGTGAVDKQATIVQTAFARPLVVTVLDPDGTPLLGETITFTVPDTGPSGTFPDGSKTATALTDANGVATSPTLTANNTVGTYTATATAAFANVNASFALTNDPAAATTTPEPIAAGTLPVTGAHRDLAPLTTVGLGLLLAGCCVLAINRRRTTHRVRGKTR